MTRYTTVTTITVQRPDGTIEHVRRARAIDQDTRRKMIEATRAAGRGEILSFVESREPYQTSWTTCPHYTPGQGCPLHGETCR